MSTPQLVDHDGNGPDQENLLRLAKIPSLLARAMLRNLPEGIMHPGEDARVVFVRGIFFRQPAFTDLLKFGEPFDFGLAAEADNPADENAVAVLLNGTKIGYLPRELAPEYQLRAIEGACRIAARGPIDISGECFSLAVLLAWKP